MSWRRRWIAREVVLVALAWLLSAFGASAQDRSKVEITPDIPHAGAVSSVAFSPDGAQVLSGSSDKTLKLWDATGQLIRTFEGHGRWVNSVAFSPDGTRVLSGSHDTTLRLWDAATGRLIRTFEGHSRPVFSVAFSPDGGQVLSGSVDKSLKLWDTATGQLIRTFEGHSLVVYSVAFSPDGTRLLSGSHDKTLKLWDAATGQLIRTFEGHTGRVKSVAFSPDGALVFSGSQDKSLKLWDAATGQLIRTFEGHSHEVHSVAFSPGGAQVLSGSSDETLKLWEAATGHLIRTFEGHSHPVYSVVFSPDGTRLLSGGGGPIRADVRMWDATNGQLIVPFLTAVSAVTSAAFSPDGTRLLSGNWDTTVELWDATGQLIRTFEGHGHWVNSAAFSPDGTRVLSGSGDSTLKLWDVATGQLIRTFKGHSRPVYSVVFSPDGGQVLSGSADKTLKLWDTATGQLIRTFEGHTDLVRSVAFSPDGTRLLSGSHDKTLKLWDAAASRLIRTFEGHADMVFSVAFSPDGTRVLSGSLDKSLKLWDATSARLIRTFDGHGRTARYGLYSVAFSPDGAQVLSGSDDSTLKLWDAATGQLIRTFEGHTGLVNSVAFSPDGTRLLSGSHDTTLRLWDAATGTQIATLVGGRRGSGGEWQAITPAGFFAASRATLGIVRGLEVYSVVHFRDHLYRPDLVEARLKGDPDGKYADAASKLNLQTILDSGPAPQIETLPERKPERIGDAIKITLRLVDTGGGIGEKVVWRVNGVTQGNVSDPNAPRTGYRVIEQALKLALGQDNIIEVTAYNGAGLLATTPWRHVEGKFGEPSGARMHIIAVGVSEYVRKDWRLSYAANDAKAFAELMQASGRARGLYDDVKVSLLLDSAATERGIGAAIERMRADVQASDVFILYLAGHGKHIADSYYFLPQDLTFEAGRTIQKDAINQDKLQRWLALIPAQKSILILDTCESEGAARSLAVERETAVERLRHATGRSVIAAASAAAYEGYNGHGLLTWAIRDAFTQGDGSDGFVELLQLAAHIDREVPVISQKWLGVVQRPHHKIEGNFPLGGRLANLPLASDAKLIPKTPTHVLIRPERVRERPAPDAPGERQLSPGAQVHVLRLADQWAVVAREGQELGYVPADALARLQ